MDRRQFHIALASTALLTLNQKASAQPTAKVEPEPVKDAFLIGIRAMLEIEVRNTFDPSREPWPASMPQHLKDGWAHWQRFGPPKLSEGSPWTRYEAFESLTRYAAKRTWDTARNTLIVDVHRFGEPDVTKLRKSDKAALAGPGGWATAVFEGWEYDRLHHRILGDVVELHLAWLLDNRDRYPRNPAARHAQIEAEDWQICTRVARALCYGMFDAMAEEERRLRADPSLAGTHVQLKAVLTQLGPAPSGAMPRVVPAGPVKDPLQPR